jgi:hypothetical protein
VTSYQASVNYVIGQLQHVFGNSQVIVMTHITEK